MSHIVDPYAHQAYRLVESAFSYNGECSICTREKTDNFSLHQISQEEYDEMKHGPIVKKDHLQGIYKVVEIDNRSSESTGSVARTVFHQVACSPSGRRCVFSPMHSACAECIKTLKKADNFFRCHMCRFEIKIIKKKSKTKSFENLITFNSMAVQSHAEVYSRMRRIAKSEDNLVFSNLSKSQKRSHVSRVRNDIQAIGIDIYLGDDDFFIEDNEEIQSYDESGIGSTFSSARNRRMILSEFIDFDNIPRLKTKKKTAKIA